MSQARKAAWAELAKAAAAAAKSDFMAAESRALSEAACAWAAQNGYTRVTGAPTPPVLGTNKRTLRSGHVVPFGRSKGTPLEEAARPDLEWLEGAIQASVDDPEKERFRAKNVELLEAIRAELASR